MKRSGMNSLTVCFVAILSTAAGYLFLKYSSESADAVCRGIELCGVSVIPSLFPMMFVSQYMIVSGAAELAGSLIEKPTRFLFGLPGVCGVALLTAFVGGYPAGAGAAESLVESGRITAKEGQRLASIAFCSGPGFSIGMIGAGLYQSKSAGLLILTAQAFSCIILGTVLRLTGGGFADAAEKTETAVNLLPDRSDAFVRAAVNTASALLNMCSFIILFQVITAMLDVAGINRGLGILTRFSGLGECGEYLLPCLTEVTAGSILSVKAGLPFTAFVAGFGGLSVHFQNFAVCRKVLPDRFRYGFIRLMQGALCSLIVYTALKLPCFASLSQCAAGSTVGGIPAEFPTVSVEYGCVMLLMCLMSVICLPKMQKELI